jgi:hypothetical protein
MRHEDCFPAEEDFATAIEGLKNHSWFYLRLQVLLRFEAVQIA